MLPHEDFEEGDSIHLWHLDIEHHHIRLEFQNLVPGHVRIRGRAHDFNLGIGTQNLGNRFAVHQRVIHQQDPDFFSWHGLGT